MTLTETFKRLQRVMEPLGVEIGKEVLHVWLDRGRTGQEPLPEAALRDLAQWAEKLLADRT